MANESPIHVGSGYLDVTPRIDRSALNAFREQVVKSIDSAGAESGKAFVKSFSGAVKSGKISAKELLGPIEVSSKESGRVAGTGFSEEFATAAEAGFAEALEEQKASSTAMVAEARRAGGEAGTAQAQAMAEGSAGAAGAMAASARTGMRRFNSEVESGLLVATQRWGHGVEKFGTGTAELGRLINHNIVLPVLGIGTAMTFIGGKSADSFTRATMQMKNFKVSASETQQIFNELQDFALKTPYNFSQMEEYEAVLTRTFKGGGTAAKQAAKDAKDAIETIANSLAESGNTTPAAYNRAMNAYGYMEKAGKLDTRHLRMMVEAGFSSEGDIARLLGFKSSGAMLKQMATPGGAIPIEDFNTKVMPAIMKLARGAAEKSSTSTMGGKWENFKENMAVKLRGLFLKQDKSGHAILDKNGSVEYTKFGENISKMLDDVGSKFDKWMPVISSAVNAALPGVRLLFDGFGKAADLVEKQPGWMKDLEKFGMMAATVLGPGLLIAGTGFKILGKSVNLAMSPFKLALSFFRQLGSGVKNIKAFGKAARAKMSGGSFRDTWNEHRSSGGGDDTQSKQMKKLSEAAKQAKRDVQAVSGAVEALDQKRITQAINQFSGGAEGEGGGRSLKSGADAVKRSLREVETAVGRVDSAKLSGISGRFSPELTSKINEAKDAIGVAKGETGLRAAISRVNAATLGTVKQEFDSLSRKVKDAKSDTGNLISRIRDLNGISLGSLKSQFSGKAGLDAKVKNTSTEVGTEKSGLRGRISGLNGMGLGRVHSQVTSLKDAFGLAKREADNLKKAIRDVDDQTGGGGGGGGGGKHRKKASLRSTAYQYTGTFYGGYGGGSIGGSAGAGGGSRGSAPAARAGLLGAAPESALLGRGLGRGLGKGGGGRGGIMGMVDEFRSFIDERSFVRVIKDVAAFNIAKECKGGKTGRDLRGWADGKAAWAGEKNASNLSGLPGWIAQKLPIGLEDQIEGFPWTQLAGIAIGAMGPSIAKNFSADVWHGTGNIAERGLKFTSDTFTPMALLHEIGDGLKSIWDTVKEVVSDIGQALSFAKELLTDPKKALTGAVEMIEDNLSEMWGSLKSDFELFRLFVHNPGGYLKESFSSFLSGLKDLLPNTDGLFAFADGGNVPGYAPGRDSVRAILSPGESVLRPEAADVMGRDRITALNAAAKSKDWKRMAEIMQSSWQGQIKPAMDGMSVELKKELTPATEQFEKGSQKSWKNIGQQIDSTWGQTVRPAWDSWTKYLSQDMTSKEKQFDTDNRNAWHSVSTQINQSKNASLTSFVSLKSGVEGVRSKFDSSASSIRSVWGSAMSYVDSSTRSTISGPFNNGAVRMMGEMASLAGTGNPLSPLSFSTGGVVPGYRPGVDTIPAMLSEGEGILRPEVVRALGHETIHEWNKAARLGGNIFANGGIVGPISAGSDGGAWVKQHKDDPYSGYMEAIGKGWAATIQPGLDDISRTFRSAGEVNAKSFAKGLPWLQKRGKYWDDHSALATTQAAKDAIAVERSRSESGGANWYELCEMNVETAWKYSGLYASARAAYEATSGAVQSASNIPPGAALYWPNIGGAYGHIAMADSTPGYVWSNDVLRSGYIDRVPMSSITEGWGAGTPYWAAAIGSHPLNVAQGGGHSDGTFNPWPGSIPKTTGTSGPAPQGQLLQWIQSALAATHTTGSQWLSGLGVLINRESSGNPNAVNNWDSNAAAGDPSKGLCQVIGATFRAYHQDGTSWNILDPVANIAAAINYIKAVYGDISNVQQANPNLPPKGYYTGTRSASKGVALVGERGPELVDFQGGERVWNDKETARLLGGKGDTTITINAAPDVPTEHTLLRVMDRAAMMHGMLWG